MSCREHRPTHRWFSNPAVSIVMAWRGALPARLLASYIAVQLFGAMLGAWLANHRYISLNPLVAMRPAARD
jgi:hypothetical protein